MSAGVGYRGLKNFIDEIRQCQSKEQENARIDKELANIRTKFKSDRGKQPTMTQAVQSRTTTTNSPQPSSSSSFLPARDRARDPDPLPGLSSYEKKKYIWKLLYIYVLGYDVEFGHMEAVALISSTKFSEKQVGYIAASVLLHENLEFVRLVINTMQKDLVSRDENWQCMALTAIANMGGREFAEALSGEVLKLLLSSSTRTVVRKKAALCVLRLFRRNPDIIDVNTFALKIGNLLQERDLGVLLSSMSLLCGVVSVDSKGYEVVIPKVVGVLERVAKGIDIPQDYTYYGIPSPWLHVKALRVLHYFPVIENDNVWTKLSEILRRTISSAPIDKNTNKNNALHAILFESISLMMHLNMDSEVLAQCVTLLGKFVSIKEPNIRYLGLENMSRLSLVPEMMSTIKSHQEQIVLSLHDPDISIRRRALDLLYRMCDSENSHEVVDQLLNYLTTADFAIREELALKIAILSERFASSLKWYVDVIISLIDKAGDHVSDEVWYRVVQIVTNNEDLQSHAAANVLRKLQDGSSHETMLKLSSYILGEFGQLLQGSEREIFHILKDRMGSASALTKGLILSAFAKIETRNPDDAEVIEAIKEIFRRYGTIPDAELQQRAVEYAALSGMKEAATVMALMPKFPERESSLLKLMAAETAENSLPIGRARASDKDADALPSAGQSNDLLGLEDTIEGTVPVVPLELAHPKAAQNDPMDLLEGLSVSEPAAPAPASVQPAASDPFGIGGFSDLTVQNDTSTSLQPQLMGGTLEGWYTKLCVANKGVLYQDQFLQIGVKADFQKAQGRLVLFLGNKHAGELSNVVLSIPPIPSYRIQVGNVPSAIAAQAQVQVPIAVSCVEPSLDVPKLQVVYQVEGQPLKLDLQLPLIPTKFFSPVQNIDANSFFGAWKSIPSAPLKLQQILKCEDTIDISRVQGLVGSVGFTVAQGLDPSPNNIVGVGAFNCESSGETMVMLRLEVDPNTKKQYRITVASNNALLTSSTKELLLKNL